MKAIVYRSYGGPEVLRYEDVAKPVAKDDEVSIAVRAVSVNPLDWHFMRGTPYPLRFGVGLRRPETGRLGVDVAGEVEATGRSVTRFVAGDKVFGSCRGACAEFVCTVEAALAPKPDNLTFAQAASAPVAAFTALQGLRDRGRIEARHEVLIHGAAGGVGTFAVQVAKWVGANVTGVCSTRNLELVRSIGADQVIDYTRQDFTASGSRYDLVFDCIGNHSLLACRGVLRPGGTYVMVGGPDGRWVGPLGRVAKGLVLSPFGRGRLVMVLAQRSAADLALVSELMTTGKVRPVLDRTYRLREVPEAIRYLEQGHARGKVIIDVERADQT